MSDVMSVRLHLWGVRVRRVLVDSVEASRKCGIGAVPEVLG